MQANRTLLDLTSSDRTEQKTRTQDCALAGPSELRELPVREGEAHGVLRAEERFRRDLAATRTALGSGGIQFAQFKKHFSRRP